MTTLAEDVLSLTFPPNIYKFFPIIYPASLSYSIVIFFLSSQSFGGLGIS
jgi:hypothetical protein